MSNDHSEDTEKTKITLGMEVYYQGQHLDSSALSHHVSDNANAWLTSIESRNPGEAQLHAYSAQSIAEPESYREALEEHFKDKLTDSPLQSDPAKLAHLIADCGLMSVPEFINTHLNNARDYQVINETSKKRGSPPGQ